MVLIIVALTTGQRTVIRVTTSFVIASKIKHTSSNNE